MNTDRMLNALLERFESVASDREYWRANDVKSKAKLDKLRIDFDRQTELLKITQQDRLRLNADFKRAEQCWEAWQKHVLQLEEILRSKGVRKLPKRPPVLETEIPF